MNYGVFGYWPPLPHLKSGRYEVTTDIIIGVPRGAVVCSCCQSVITDTHPERCTGERLDNYETRALHDWWKANWRTLKRES